MEELSTSGGLMSYFLVKGKELKISWQLYKSVIFKIDEIFVVFSQQIIHLMRYWVLRLTFMWWGVSLDNVVEECTCVDDENYKDSFMWNLMTTKKRRLTRATLGWLWSETSLPSQKTERRENEGWGCLVVAVLLTKETSVFKGKRSCLVSFSPFPWRRHTRGDKSHEGRKTDVGMSLPDYQCCSPDFDNVRERQLSPFVSPLTSKKCLSLTGKRCKR